MSHMKIKENYVVFATSHDPNEDAYVSFERVKLEDVPALVSGETKPIVSGDGYADYSLIEMRLKGLAGRILTIIDAVIPEGQQNKCTKDLIRSKIMDEYMFYGEMLFNQDKLAKAATEAFDEGLATPVSYEKILGA